MYALPYNRPKLRKKSSTTVIRVENLCIPPAVAPARFAANNEQPSSFEVLLELTGRDKCPHSYREAMNFAGEPARNNSNQYVEYPKIQGQVHIYCLLYTS